MTKLALVAAGGDPNEELPRLLHPLRDDGAPAEDEEPGQDIDEAHDFIIESIEAYRAANEDIELREVNGETIPDSDRLRLVQLRGAIVAACRFPLGKDPKAATPARDPWPKHCLVRVRAQIEGYDRLIVQTLSRQAVDRFEIPGGMRDTNYFLSLVTAAAYCALMVVEVVAPKTAKWPRADGRSVRCAPYDLRGIEVDLDELVDEWLHLPEQIVLYIGNELVEMHKLPFGLLTSTKRT